MPNIINVTPNKAGEIFITLYGTEYQIVVAKKTPKVKAPTETVTE